MSDGKEGLLAHGIAAVEVYGIASVDPDGRVLTWNRGAERLSGYSPAEVLGRSIGVIFASRDGEDAGFQLEAVAQESAENGVWIRGPHGKDLWAKLTVVSVDPDGGGEGGYLVFFRDATRVRATEAELRRSKTMFEGILAIASDAVVCVDDGQRIVFFNEGAERMFEYEPEEVIGQPLEILIPDRFSRTHAEHVRRFGRSSVVSRQMGERGEISGKRKSGEIFPAEASISKLDLGDGHIYTAVLRDVTERRAAREELARKADELARSNAELEQFAYVASHDLQEPLRMVASFTQLLAKRYGGQLGPDADEFIGFAVEGVTRMQSLINDLLAYSRVGTKGAKFAPVDLSSILEKVLFVLGPAIEESGAAVTAHALPIVDGDATQLFQLFQNLIQNGLKFRKPQVQPKVEVTVEDMGEAWKFGVRDNGIGIAAEYQERIFIIFQRLHTRAQYPGTGIGLAICKKIVERHGGRIWVESDENGSNFFFTLPKREESGE